ncbi:hypothetical protein PF008_g28060 [Phytophthora fragariae]|uniref:Uncharacterized protein n=1 Tax=Phytophthora fragariae TaxID=53985 RepID=A0A6G0QCC9_9STRA|nr:hypothetical protein PF008_g28060 [Phytophthora fragariae]
MRMHSSLLLVRPEDFLSSSPWHPDQHAYVRVLSTQPDHVVVQDFPGSMHQGQLRLNTVQERAVTEQDANTATGEFLRKAVCGVVRGTYVYGQVESYQGKSVTVRQGDRAVRLAASRLDEIAPVVCLLMKNSAVKTSDITRAALRDFNVTILDRILGYNGWDGSRDIADILNGILPSNEQPNGSEIRTWVNPITGDMATLRLQHAVDYAHYIDGGRSVPASLQREIGETFTDDPSYREAHVPDEIVQVAPNQPRPSPARHPVSRPVTRTNPRSRTRTRTQTRNPTSSADHIVSSNGNATLTALLSELEGDDGDVANEFEDVHERSIPPILVRGIKGTSVRALVNTCI